MRNITNTLLLGIALSFVMNGCGSNPSAAPTIKTTSASPALTPILSVPTITPIPKGRTIIVTSAEDSGTGTLRQALQEAQPGDTITFDPEVFPPTDPTTIFLTSLLPEITRGYLTVDASNTGVILDGSKIDMDWSSAFLITSTGNTFQGLQIMNFRPGAGFEICCGAQHNLVGGNPNSGRGPVGQGNFIGDSSDGIVIGGEQSSFNTISGNFIGITRNGDEVFEMNAGIWIADGASRNTIGPSNTIVNSSLFGIVVMDLGTVGNTITQNSIFRNAGVGISLGEHEYHPAGNKQIDAPVITDFALQEGIVQGVTCSGCIVEIFSDKGNQGEVYEGNTTADSDGVFVFDKGGPLTGPNLTATATDDEQNTSGFSMPKSGTAGPLSLQEGNLLPKKQLQHKPSVELADNHIGGDIGIWGWKKGGDNSVTYHGLLQVINDLGLKWVRTNFMSPNPLNWQEVLRGSEVYSVPQDVDDFITDLANHGVNIVLTLSAGMGLDGPQFGWWGDPGWGLLGERESEWWLNSQEDRDEFAAYVGFMVQHFKGRVKYYEIWNEADSGENPGDPRGGVTLNDYILVVKQVAPIIRQTDPEARIVAGAVGRFYPEDREWLQTMLQSGVSVLVDSVSWHPFYGESPLLYSGEHPEHPDPYYWGQYPDQVQIFREQASSWGFEGGYMVEEMVWRTPNDLVPTETPLYSDLVAAKYAARAIIMHLGMDFEMVSNQMLMPDVIKKLPRYHVIRNLCTIMAGAETANFPLEIQSTATNIKTYSFSMLNDNTLIALWTDSISVDNDPGIPTTLIIPGFADSSAIGIDVLNGFEQKLITNNKNRDLIIRDFLLKDYPIIIRLSK